MNNRPMALTAEEINEIAALPEIQALWGGENAAVLAQILHSVYTVKFRYVNGSPGYTGDLFVIQPDVLGSEYPVTRLIRNREDKLVIL